MKTTRYHENNGNGRNEWLTPPQVFRSLGDFDLDPSASCSQAHDGIPWKTARRMICKCKDGLSKVWTGRVWLNPPYGHYGEEWIKRLADHGDGIALLFARIETVWFRRVCWERATSMLFLHKRVHFHLSDGSVGGRKGGTGSAGSPSVLVAYGARNADALRESCIDGSLVNAWYRIGRQKAIAVLG